MANVHFSITAEKGTIMGYQGMEELTFRSARMGA
jgi:hypothetical protein